MVTRINVTSSTVDDYDETVVTSVVGWFDLDRATAYREATGSQYDHEILYRTAQGRWVLHRWSQWQDGTESYRFIEDTDAREWLIAQDQDDAVREHFGEIEDERGPGRPEVGGAVHVRLGDLIDSLDTWAKDHSVSRAQAIREAVHRLVVPANQS